HAIAVAAEREVHRAEPRELLRARRPARRHCCIDQRPPAPGRGPAVPLEHERRKWQRRLEELAPLRLEPRQRVPVPRAVVERDREQQRAAEERREQPELELAAFHPTLRRRTA